MPSAVSSPITEIYHELASLDSYEPSPRVNRLFDRLVGQVVDGSGPVDLDEAAVRDLRRISATAEYELERTWSRRIAEHDVPRGAAGRFPDVENYGRIAAMEHAGLRAIGSQAPRRAVLVGGGPLPLSALCLAGHGWRGTVVDRDPVAVDRARDLVSALGADITVRHADGTDLDYAGYDLVHVAALVGDATDGGVFDRIAETADPGTVLLARSAEGRVRLLYPPLPKTPFDRFTHRKTVQPPDGVLNSAAYFTV